MLHHMKLKPEPFEMIRSGQKTYELRLYDEKRQLLRPGDVIEFSNPDRGGEPLRVEVLALHTFPSFASLYAALPLLQCGYTEETVKDASPEDMSAYYPPEEQERWGVVGIEIHQCESRR